MATATINVTMRPTDVAFFAAVATVIPVFLVVYAVGVHKTIKGFGEKIAESNDRSEQQAIAAIKGGEGRIRSSFEAIGSTVLGFLFQVAGLVLFFVAVVVPASAEYIALHSLYVDRASDSGRTVALFGTLASGVVVVGPLALQAFMLFGVPVVDPLSRAIALFQALREAQAEQRVDSSE